MYGSSNSTNSKFPYKNIEILHNKYIINPIEKL